MANARWYAVSIFFLAYLISIVDRQLLSLLLVPIQNDLQVSDTLMSTLHGFTFAFFYSVMGLPIARMIDAGNRRLIIAVGIFVWSLATAGCGLATEYWHLLIARTLVATGEAALLPGIAYPLMNNLTMVILFMAVFVFFASAPLGTAPASIQDMTPGQSESIRVVEEICEDLHYPMELQTGDIQFLNNMVALHARNGFEDWPEQERKRLLWRLWLTVPGIRPLTPFMAHWRTGLLLKRTEPRINLRLG